jgi:hypothetical protein
MKITIEMDSQIYKDAEPEHSRVVVEQAAETLQEALQLVKQALLGFGYVFDGDLVIEQYEESLDIKVLTNNQ